MIFSPQIREFFTPIFSKHKKIFLLLLLDGAISGLVSVVMPLLLKWETDQLMQQRAETILGIRYEPFTVFVIILIIIVLIEAVSRVVSRITGIFLEARKDYLQNSIQLELFRHMKNMEVGRAMNARFRHIANVLRSEFQSFSSTLINLPGSTIQKGIQILGITAIFAYFDIRLLAVVIVSATLSYWIDRYSEILREKYNLKWKFSLGQKVYFYNDLFLRLFGQLAINGAVSNTISKYEHILTEGTKQGIRKNWSDLVWGVSSLLTGSVSQMIIKVIVGYSVFQGTQSIGMVALVVASLGTVEDIMRSILSVRKGYLRFRFQESSILLFLHMCEPIGHKARFRETLSTIQMRDVSFAYPNISVYEKQYIDVAKTFIKKGRGGDKWVDEMIDEMIEGVEEDIALEMPTIIHDTSIAFERGKIYGIVGRNGAGKTTLMQLLAGFYRGYQGEILFNNSDTREWTPELLATQISFLTQEPFFMDWGANLRDNLLLGVEDTDETELWKYLEAFHLAKKIRALDEGLDAEIGENMNFSGGEKQILAFIRLLLQDRPIVILDEGTNQLDAENEVLVMDELLRQKEDKIIIFITHRMSTISRADTIYCIEDGTVSASGGHTELLGKGDNIYANFYRKQVLHH